MFQLSFRTLLYENPIKKTTPLIKSFVQNHGERQIGISIAEFKSTKNLCIILIQNWKLGGKQMEGPLRSIVAGVAAWKLGGGCLSTIVIFLIVFYLLGFVNCQLFKGQIEKRLKHFNMPRPFFVENPPIRESRQTSDKLY